MEPEVHNSILVAVMFAASFGVQWRGTGSTDRESWSSARNRPANALRDDPDVDGIMWIDSDMLVPREAFAKLAANPDKEYDLISGLYTQREPPYWPNAFKYDKKRKGFERLMEWEPNKICPIDGFGFGCCYTSTKLLRALPESPFKFDELSEDLGFCKAAAKAGFQPYLDTGVECSHLEGSQWANIKKFERWRRVLLTRGNPEKGQDDGFVHDGGKENVHGLPAVP
jgi:hypothetical protein